jgi:23S rRNA pseudouridine2457 synthase
VTRYLIFNKPYEVLSTFTDEGDRTTLKQFIPVPGVYSAGRLDYKSEGLLLLTDDGALAHRMTHPRHEHPKTYLVQVEGLITTEAVETLRQGMIIKGEKTLPAEVETIPEPALWPRPVPVRDYHPTSWLKIVLREGKKRQIRHMTAAVAFPTLRLVRVAIGPIQLGNLEPGEWRELEAGEIKMLKRLNVKRDA